MKTQKSALSLILRWLPVIAILLLATTSYAANDVGGSATVKSVASTWLNLAGWIMIGGAGLCFIFGAYQAFQREWSSAAVGILVCILLGFGPSILGWAANQWGVGNGTNGTGALFLK